MCVPEAISGGWTFPRSIGAVCYGKGVCRTGLYNLPFFDKLILILCYLFPHLILTYEMAIISKISKPVSFNSHTSLNISFSNIRGLRTNFVSCESFLLTQSPDIFALCETNLDGSIDSNSFAVSGYLPLIRRDSSTHMHGLGVYIKEGLPLARETAFETLKDSYLCFRLALIHSTSYLFFLYRSPSSTSCEILDSISTNIEKALALHPTANIFVFGDFNAHHSDWLTFSNGTNIPGERSYNFAVSHDLDQIINQPTRIPDTDMQEPTLLDLFLTSDKNICSSNLYPPLGRSDHVVVSVTVDFAGRLEKESPFHRKVFDYSRADWDSFRDHLRDVPWEDIFCRGASFAASEFAEWVQVAVDEYIPNRKFQVTPHSSPWFTPACAAAIVHRNHFFRLYHRDRNDATKTLYRQASNRCKRIIESAKLHYFEKTRDAIASQKLGSRDFWRIVNSVLNRKKSVIPPLFNGPEVLTSALSKAEQFAKLFSENSNLDDSGAELPSFPSRTERVVDSIDVTPELVKEIILSLDSSKASGPDRIPVTVLKNCEPEFSFILAQLFNLCLRESCFPSCWKVSSVVPVFKNGGDRSKPRDYRPVSLLSVVSKVFERLINNTLMKHLEDTGLFSDFQYGFRSSRSTGDLLTVVTDRVARALNKTGATRAVALDISKAFDRVWHAGLLQKIKAYGVSGEVFEIIASFLGDRKLRVAVDGKLSQEFAVNAGVPQGSILGPTLFLLYINDLPDHVISNIAIYADDTTIYSSCDKVSDEFERLCMSGDLEGDLRDVVDWGKRWLVSFNAKKTQLISFDNSNSDHLDIKMGASLLDEKSSFKMLGLSFTSKLEWGSYIDTIAKTAAKKIGALGRSIKFLSPEVILYLYKSTIRPCLEYCCHVWAGAPKCYLDLLDRLQNRVCKMVGDTLAASLEPLAQRRDVASLSLFYRYYHSKCSSELADLVPVPHPRTRATRYSEGLHDFAVSIPRLCKGVYANSFFPRTAKIWNSLPADCFPLTYDLNQFKSNVNKYLATLSLP